MFKTLVTSLMALVAVGLLAGPGVGAVDHGPGQGGGQGGQARPRRHGRRRVQGRREPEVPDQDRSQRRLRAAADRVGRVPGDRDRGRRRVAERSGARPARAGRRRQHRPGPGRRRRAMPRRPRSRRPSRKGWPPAAPAITMRAIAKFNAAAAVIPNCADCYYNIGVSYMAKKDEKQAEEAWKKVARAEAGQQRSGRRRSRRSTTTRSASTRRRR